jgi:hypothetical protein
MELGDPEFILVLMPIAGVSLLVNVWLIGEIVRRSRCSKIQMGCIECQRNVLSDSVEERMHTTDPMRGIVAGLGRFVGTTSMSRMGDERTSAVVGRASTVADGITTVSRLPSQSSRTTPHMDTPARTRSILDTMDTISDVEATLPVAPQKPQAPQQPQAPKQRPQAPQQPHSVSDTPLQHIARVL